MDRTLKRSNLEPEKEKDNMFKKPFDKTSQMNQESGLSSSKSSKLFGGMSSSKPQSPFKTGEGRPANFMSKPSENPLTSSKPKSTSIFGKKDEKKENTAENKSTISAFSVNPNDKLKAGVKDNKDSKQAPFKSNSAFQKPAGDSAKPASSVFGKKDNDAGLKASSGIKFGNKDKAGEKKEEDKKADNKEESKNKAEDRFGLKAPKDVIHKSSLTDIEKQNIDSKRLEDIASNWYNSIENQSETFAKHAKQLKAEELALYDNISTLESMNQHSNKLINDYSACELTMQELCRQQNGILDVLEKVENELDNALGTNNINQQHQPFHTIRDFVSYSSQGISNKGANYRQKMDATAD